MAADAEDKCHKVEMSMGQIGFEAIWVKKNKKNWLNKSDDLIEMSPILSYY